MAIVEGLFGLTPEMYQREQSALADARALQYAKLDPFQQANFAIGRGANQLAGAVGGALGGTDPELQRITQRQQIASQINLTDPESIQQGMVLLQQVGDTVGMQQLAQIYRQQQESGALISQREAAAEASLAAAKREKVPTTSDLTNARAIAAQAGPEGSPEYIAAFNAEYKRLTTKADNAPSFGVDAEREARAEFGKPFNELTQTQQKIVNKLVEEKQGSKAKAGAPSITNVLPGQKDLIDIPKFRRDVQQTIDPQIKTVNAADQALEAINNSLATGNFASFRAGQTQFARAISGTGDLSQKELLAAGADPSLLGGTADYLSKLFSGTPTADTQKQIRSTLLAIKKVATKKANAELSQQRKLAERAKYAPSDIDAALNFPEFNAPTPASTKAPVTRTLKSGKVVTVED